MSRNLVPFMLAQPLLDMAGEVAVFWDNQAQRHRCEHCEAENRLQMALAGCGEDHPNLYALRRLLSFAPATRVYLHYHRTQTDLATHLRILEDFEVMCLRQFVLNFLHIEHRLLHRMGITYHQWIRGGYRDQLSRLLQHTTELYNSVQLLHTAGTRRPEELALLCQEIQSQLSASATTG